jgi:hypothetical protein
LPSRSATTSHQGAEHVGGHRLEQFSRQQQATGDGAEGAGRSHAVAQGLCIGTVALTGFAIGWRRDAGAASIIGGFGLALFFS